jgi:2-polyprenyl-3-methyl-5-hydroxy-6-metoxy-1,4-benzoquinol methylase
LAGEPSAGTRTPRPVTAAQTNSTGLAFTGERFLPEVRGAIYLEHWHRYAITAALVRGRRVLDAACGEGYGTSLLAASAASVVGVDVSADAVAHATTRYAAANVRFVQASVTCLPLTDASVDAVVSFETIEHLAEQREMLAEFRRVLAPSGILVISSPNRPVYNEDAGAANHFHVRELDRDELARLLAPGFPQQAWYAQRVLAQSAIWAQGTAHAGSEFVTIDGPRPEPAPPMYFLVVAASERVALPPLPALSLFDDGASSLWRDYVRALTRERELAWDEIDARRLAEQRLAEVVALRSMLAAAEADLRKQAAHMVALDRTLAETQSRAQAAIERLEREYAERERTFAAQLADAQAAHAQEAAACAREAEAHAQTRTRLAYRETARGWLRFPLMALRERLVEKRR